MIRISAFLVAGAIVVLVAGVLATSLALVYVSIAVSVLAAGLLTVGVLRRREEIFGEAGAMPAAPAAPAAPVSQLPAWADAAASGAGPGSSSAGSDAASRSRDALSRVAPIAPVAMRTIACA